MSTMPIRTKAKSGHNEQHYPKGNTKLIKSNAIPYPMKRMPLAPHQPSGGMTIRKRRARFTWITPRTPRGDYGISRNGERVLRMEPIPLAIAMKSKRSLAGWNAMALHFTVDRNPTPARSMIETLEWLMSPRIRGHLSAQGTVAYIGFSKNKALIRHAQAKYGATASSYLTAPEEARYTELLFGIRQSERRNKYNETPVHMIIIPFPNLTPAGKKLFQQMVSNRYQKVMMDFLDESTNHQRHGSTESTRA